MHLWFPIIWICCSSHHDTTSIYPFLEPGLALWVALARRMWQSWWCSRLSLSFSTHFHSHVTLPLPWEQVALSLLESARECERKPSGPSFCHPDSQTYEVAKPRSAELPTQPMAGCMCRMSPVKTRKTVQQTTFVSKHKHLSFYSLDIWFVTWHHCANSNGHSQAMFKVLPIYSPS